jgi:hypothetical protein
MTAAVDDGHTPRAFWLRRAAFVIISAGDPRGFWVNQVNLRTHRAIHRHKCAFLGIDFFRDETLHPVTRRRAFE